MNSIERHEKRYLNRKAKRETQTNFVLEFQDFDEIFSLDHLYEAGLKCCKGVRWKSSVINFEAFLLNEVSKLREELLSGTYKYSGFIHFKTIEHGKLREIDALLIKDRTVQACVCMYIATQTFSRSFIYDNSASLANKGMLFAQQRLKLFLTQHYNKYGYKGGVLTFDFSGYFASLNHKIMKERINKKFKDKRIVKLLQQFVDDFKNLQGITQPDNIEEYHGVGLGSPFSQILALDYVNPIDHIIKEKFNISGYERYMDDGIIIHHDLKKLYEIREKLITLAKELNIKINEKKTYIIPFKGHSFSFLKIRYRMQSSGKITMKINRKSVKNIRRKLKIFRQWLNEGTFTIEDICVSYQSWRGYSSKIDSYKTVNQMDVYFVTLFENELKLRKNPFKCSLIAIKTKQGWVYKNHKGNKINEIRTSNR